MSKWALLSFIVGVVFVGVYLYQKRRYDIQQYSDSPATNPQIDVNNIKPYIGTTSIVMLILASVLMIGGAVATFYFDNLPWNKMPAVFLIILGAIIASIILFKNVNKSRYEEYNHDLKRKNDALDLANKGLDFKERIDNESVKAAERQNLVDKYRMEIEALKIKMLNELVVAEAANRNLLSIDTYNAICLMRAQAAVELIKMNHGFNLEIAQKRELKQIELEAEERIANLEIKMAGIESLYTFHEYAVLNNELSGLYLQLEEAQKLPETNYKISEVARINNQIKVLEKKISKRSKRLS